MEKVAIFKPKENVVADDSNARQCMVINYGVIFVKSRKKYYIRKI